MDVTSAIYAAIPRSLRPNLDHRLLEVCGDFHLLKHPWGILRVLPDQYDYEIASSDRFSRLPDPNRGVISPW